MSRREHIPGHFPSRFDRFDSLVRAEYLLTIFKAKWHPAHCVNKNLRGLKTLILTHFPLVQGTAQPTPQQMRLCNRFFLSNHGLIRGVRSPNNLRHTGLQNTKDLCNRRLRKVLSNFAQAIHFKISLYFPQVYYQLSVGNNPSLLKSLHVCPP